MTPNFKSNDVAIITGAASGIGQATALAFAQNGVRTIVSDISVAAGQDVARTITSKYDVPSYFIKCDVSKDEEVKNLIQDTLKKFGQLNYAFNNAGVAGLSHSTAESAEDEWNQIIDTNLKGVWHCMKYEIDHMLKHGGGSIVNCASIAGLVGFANSPAYTASKHGVIGLTKAAALENAKSHIRINAVCPGVIQTPMIDQYTQGKADLIGQLTAAEPMGRIGTPDEIAQAVLWLCSSASSFVTGHPLVVDGGWVAQ